MFDRRPERLHAQRPVVVVGPDGRDHAQSRVRPGQCTGQRCQEVALLVLGSWLGDDDVAGPVEDRLPADVHNAQALDAWFKKLPEQQKRALEWSLDDLLVGDETDADRFPPVIELGDARLAVKYRFEPGAIDDGMTVAVPLHLLNALDPVRLGWLAPGLASVTRPSSTGPRRTPSPLSSGPSTPTRTGSSSSTTCPWTRPSRSRRWSWSRRVTARFSCETSPTS